MLATVPPSIGFDRPRLRIGKEVLPGESDSFLSQRLFKASRVRRWAHRPHMGGSTEMKSINLWGRSVAVAALLLLIGVPGSFAQSQTGSCTALSSTIRALRSGVTVTLSGQGAPAVQVTDVRARTDSSTWRRVPTSWKPSSKASPASSTVRDIGVGRDTEIEVTMIAAVEDVITVTAESPLLDERRISTGAPSTRRSSRRSRRLVTPGPSCRRPRRSHRPRQRGRQRARSAARVRRPRLRRRPVGLGGGRRGDHRHGDPRLHPGVLDFDTFEEMQVSTGGSDTTTPPPASR